jgi:hypothetical protein
VIGEGEMQQWYALRQRGRDQRDGGRPRWVYIARLDVAEFRPPEGPPRMISLIKIGTSLCPGARLANYDRGSNATVTLLACFRGGFPEEEAMHERFENSRLPNGPRNHKSELFYPTRDVLAFVEELLENPENHP